MINSTKVKVPPIKSQGIKTKLVPWIKSIVPNDFKGAWVEPFMGTGVVAFNIAANKAILCDTNPHLVTFYSMLANKEITATIVRNYLKREGRKLFEKGGDHYYWLRDRFNKYHDPLDFLFLNRAGFNGMIRFNKKGEFNIPFCRKPNRFAPAYITKITNQVDALSMLFKTKHFEFKRQNFLKTISEARPSDIIYCDPPYIDRHVDYYNGWTTLHEEELFEVLSDFKGKFILSTWHHNAYRQNEYIKRFWRKFNIVTQNHFYHVGGSEKNRNSIVEALITNFDAVAPVKSKVNSNQLLLFDKGIKQPLV
jgi:DNA adenine methylase